MELRAQLGVESVPSAAGENSICWGAAMTTTTAPNGAYCVTWTSETNGLAGAL